MEFLYHLTTEKGLKGILNDMEIRPTPTRLPASQIEILYEGNYIFFAESVEICKKLSPCVMGELISNSYKNKIFKNMGKLLEKNAYCKFIDVVPTFFVLKIPINWIGETKKRKNMGYTEYLHYGSLKLPEKPEILTVVLPSYKELIRIKNI